MPEGPEQVIWKLAEADRLISEREGSEGAAGHLEIIESTDYPWGTQTGG